MCRLDLLWTVKFQNEKHEVETVSTISRLLLENILPKHVAEIIIKENMSQVNIIRFVENKTKFFNHHINLNVEFFRVFIMKVMIMLLLCLHQYRILKNFMVNQMQIMMD
jgi:hypothetical protein